MNEKQLQLYLVLDPVLCVNDEQMLLTTRLAVENGVSIVQLRAPQWKKKPFYQMAVRLKALLDHYAIPLIINDHIDIALAVDAAGVHIGQQDLPVPISRKLLGPNKLLGLSISNQQQFNQLPLDLIDYIGVGPIYATQTKPDADPAMGCNLLRQLMQHKPCPTVAIGGIDHTNGREVMQCGVDGIAVVSAICGQAEVMGATRRLKNLLEKRHD